MIIEGGYTISYINSDDFINRMGSNNDNTDIITVGFFNNLFTRKGYCISCKGKVKYKKESDCSYKFRYEFNNNNWGDCDAFLFDSQCDCCGARYFKHNDNLYYIIDDSIINHRKAKINRLRILTK